MNTGVSMLSPNPASYAGLNPGPNEVSYSGFNPSPNRVPYDSRNLSPNGALCDSLGQRPRYNAPQPPALKGRHNYCRILSPLALFVSASPWHGESCPIETMEGGLGHGG